ncbi:MAG: oligoendopeptidase F family protein, partial [Spartobacteria bacterium]|nr:oligoendopeptidase F family protein [Spartobacteria bacterium]
MSENFMKKMKNDSTSVPKNAIPERRALDPATTWDLSSLYAVDEDWEADFCRVDEATRALEAMRGGLTSAEAIARLFDADKELDALLDRLYTFAHLRADEDTAHNENQARLSRIRSLYTETAGRLAWISPEILSHPEDEIVAWTQAPALADYRYVMQKLLRRKPHTLSCAEETLLSRAGEIFSAASHTFDLLTNADLTFPDVADEHGHPQPLSEGRYMTFLIHPDRGVRKRAFTTLLDTYGHLKNTLASTLSTNLKTHNFGASVRHFDSALEASLHTDQIPLALYESLIEAAHRALPAFYEYIQLRKKCLRIEALDIYDMYVPIVPDMDKHIPFEQAAEWVVESCRPLGDAYLEILQSAFTDRWMDIYENRGKRSGAYSSGCYDSLPYVLLNYDGTLNDVFTLAHELGHSMHTWLANKTQPRQYTHYPIFIAEIASTLNEELLLRYLLRTHEDPRFRAYLLNHKCDGFKGTVYRQTMFAEFEKMLHALDAEGVPLTPDALGERY